MRVRLAGIVLLITLVGAGALSAASRPPRELHRVGDHWTAGERLVDLIIRIGQMLAYQDYNIKSPLNGEAAMWADLNPKKLPVDSQNLQLADAV